MVWIIDVFRIFFGRREAKTSRRSIKKKITKPQSQKHLRKRIKRKTSLKKFSITEKPVSKKELKVETIDIETPVRTAMITDVKTVKPEDSLREALETLSEYNLTGLPVVSKNKVVGVISETDIMRVMNVKNILDAEKDEMKFSMLQKLRVADAMSKTPISINENEKITHASDLMVKHDINRLIVTDEKNNLVGVITKEDIIKALSSEIFSKLISKEAGRIIETNVDSLIKIIENQGSANVKELSKKLNVDQEHIELWGKVLEQRGLIEMRYPPFGPAILRKKK